MDIKKAITRLAGREKISDDELFSSKAFFSYARGIMKGVLAEKTRVPQLEFAHEKRSSTAYTNGNLIHVNYASGLVKNSVNQSQRFLIVLGLLLHECAHCLYSDFSAKSTADQAIGDGWLWPQDPETETEAELTALEEIKAEMQDPRIRNLLQYAFSKIENVISDFHDEACIKAAYGTLVNTCIDAQRHTDITGLPVEKLEEANLSEMELFFTLLLRYIFNGDFIVLNDETNDENVLCREIREMSGIIDRARYSNDMAVTYTCINQLMLHLWPYMKDALNQSNAQNSSGNAGTSEQSDAGSGSAETGAVEQSNSGSQDQSSGPSADTENSSGSGSTSGYTDSAIEQVLNQLQNAVENAGQGNQIAPQGRRTSTAAKNGTPENAAMNQNESMAPSGASAENDEFQNLINQLKTEKAADEIEREEAKKLEVEAENGLSDADQGKLQLTRILDYPEYLENEYTQVLATVSQYSRILQKRIRDILKDLNYDGLLRKNYGRILKAQEAYRVDGQYFYKKQRPSDLPDLCVAIVLDCSGSMFGSKIELCRRAGILLEDFCSGLKVPFFMAGHNSCTATCNMNVVVPFERATNRDKYRIMMLDADGCNRDGLALKTAVNLMAKRPEQAKLLFMISDGRPTEYASIEVGIADIREGLKEAERRKIQVIACGIDEDKDLIREIYGASRFLAVDDLGTMPQKLCNIIKRNMLKFA